MMLNLHQLAINFKIKNNLRRDKPKMLMIIKTSNQCSNSGKRVNKRIRGLNLNPIRKRYKGV